MAELATLYSVGSLPFAAINSVCSKLSKKDEKLFLQDYETVKSIETKRVTNTVIIQPSQAKLFTGVYELDNPFPIVEVEYSNGEKYCFKILFPFSGAGKQ